MFRKNLFLVALVVLGTCLRGEAQTRDLLPIAQFRSTLRELRETRLPNFRSQAYLALSGEPSEVNIAADQVLMGLSLIVLGIPHGAHSEGQRRPVKEVFADLRELAQDIRANESSISKFADKARVNLGTIAKFYREVATISERPYPTLNAAQENLINLQVSIELLKWSYLTDLAVQVNSAYSGHAWADASKPAARVDRALTHVIRGLQNQYLAVSTEREKSQVTNDLTLIRSELAETGVALTQLFGHPKNGSETLSAFNSEVENLVKQTNCETVIRDL